MTDLHQAAARLHDAQRPLAATRAPEENGVNLATIPRRDGDQLRVSWAEYQGRNFVNVRVWTEGSDGQWWPQKDKGLTVRLAELPDFAAGIAKAVDMALEVPGATAQAQSGPQGAQGVPTR